MAREQRKHLALGEIRRLRDALPALQHIRYFFTFSARFSANTFLALSRLRALAAILRGLLLRPPRAPASSIVILLPVVMPFHCNKSAGQFKGFC